MGRAARLSVFRAANEAVLLSREKAKAQQQRNWWSPRREKRRVQRPDKREEIQEIRKLSSMSRKTSRIAAQINGVAFTA